MNIIIDISPDPDVPSGYLYALYTEQTNAKIGEVETTLIGSGQEDTLEGVFVNLQSLTERTI